MILMPANPLPCVISAVDTVGVVVPIRIANADVAVKADGLVTVPVQVRSTPETDDVQLPGAPAVAPPPMTSPSASAEMKQAGGAKDDDRVWDAAH